MGKESPDWEDMHETTLNKLDELSVHVHDEDGDGGVDDAAASSEDHDRDEQDDAASEDSDNGSDDDTVPWGQRALQLLAIRANSPISSINAYDWVRGHCIYVHREGQVQEEGMVDLVLIGPSSPLMAYGCFTLEVFTFITTASDSTKTGKEVHPIPITYEWDVCDGYDGDGEEPKEYTETFCQGSRGMFEITFLVIPSAIEANVEVRLKLKDLGSRSRAVYGKIKASSTDYGNKRVHLFSCERGRSWTVPSGSSSVVLPLSPSAIALPSLPYRRKLEFQLEVDLTVVTISDNQEEEKNLKFTGLNLSHKVRSQEREVDGDQVEVDVTWNRIVAM
ncbi:unnamed protein product [Urochloa decumbens]|uniref:DUF6598 domain-containing protein n=1 Tax=Urochloa decumbens TaxID=240449 RepID=A0ABC8WLV2_9POAL